MLVLVEPDVLVIAKGAHHVVAEQAGLHPGRELPGRHQTDKGVGLQHTALPRVGWAGRDGDKLGNEIELSERESPFLIEAIEVGEHERDLGLRLEQCHLALELAGQPAVVGVEEGDVAAGRAIEPRVPGHRDAVARQAGAPDPGILDGAQHRWRVVGGTIVHHDHLDVLDALGEDAGDGLRKELRVVPARNDDGNEGWHRAGM